MKFLALEHELSGATADKFQPLLKDEARCVWELQQSGALREIYFHAEKHTAVIVLECAHVEEARHLLATLPLVQAGLIDFELIPLVAYDGFARLFTRPVDGEVTDD
jgi:muconolactone delta-isomerase